ncbi:MAG: DUF29 family protein [Pseudanabaenaceae cyanobacterium]
MPAQGAAPPAGYDTNGCAGTQSQTQLLLAQDRHGHNWANLAAEITSLEKQQKRESGKRLGVALGLWRSP